MTGVRAYERRADLRANNQRLIDYARAGGTVIVNYNKFEFNEAQYGPYPGQGRARARDRRELGGAAAPAAASGVHHAESHHAMPTGRAGGRSAGCTFSTPPAAIPQIVDLLELEDPFPYNKGPKRGALVEAKVGAGPMDLRGSGPLAPAAGRHRRRVPPDGQPDQPRACAQAGVGGRHPVAVKLPDSARV